jgi:PAS domain S-box-containing protein
MGSEPSESPTRDQYRVLFEESPVPIFVYDRHTQELVAVSNSVIENYGYSREELLSMTVMDLQPQEDLAAYKEYRERVLAGDHPGRKRWSGVWRHKLKNGAIIAIEVTGNDLLYDGRECRMAYCPDVTARNGAAEELAEAREQLTISERRHRTLFERSPFAVAASDHETFRYIAVSDALVARYGYTREELMTMTIFDLIAEEQREEMLAYVIAHPEGTRGPRPGRGLPITQRFKDGTLIDVEVTSHVIELEGQLCRIAFYNDVTERNRVAAELERAHDRAVEASNTKSAFLANMSHELRTPMNGVVGMNELLLDSRLNDEQRAHAEQVARSGSQMLAIINDILDISKLEAGHVELDVTNFDLRELIVDACAGPRADATAKNVEVAIDVAADVPQLLRGDGRRLQQLVLNLVSNAVKFTRAGKVSVWAKASAVDERAALLSICVADTGIGIEAEALERMFEPFSQADVSTTRIYGGTGLGLAIVRELADLMGGIVSAESELGKGSAFTATLKFERPSLRSAGADTAPARVPVAIPTWREPPAVLVVEDSTVNQIVAARALERCGCRVEVAADGREALEALSARNFDAVLMDCQMPVLDGYAATGELRERELRTGEHTPVIAMTAHAMDGDRERCLAAGMDDYISKPMRREELAEILRRWIPPSRAGAGAAMRRRAAGRRSRTRAAR